MADPHDKKSVEDAWVKILQKSMSNKVTVIIAEELTGENRSRAPKPYVTIKVVSGPSPLGSDEELRVDKATGNTVLSSHRKFSISLQMFGEGASNALSLFHTKMYGPTGIRTFRKAKMGITDRGEVIDIAAEQNVGFERRSQLDISFLMASNVIEEVVATETVKIKGTLTKPDGSQIEADIEPITKP